MRVSAVLSMVALASAAHADLNRVGPANVPSPPGNGFPLWYQDLNGMVLDLCIPTAAADPDRALQETACLLGPPAPPLPFTFPTSFPDELFYNRVVSDPLLTSADGKRAILVLALEAAFGTGAPAAGQQMVFTRIRVTAGVPFDGDYTVTHPYGTEFFPNVVSGPGSRDIVFSEDIGITPGNFTDALASRLGPFLQPSNAPGGPPVAPVVIGGRQFLGDGVTAVPITGSPFGTNFFELCGPLPVGGTNYQCFRQDLFAMTGMLRDLVANPIGSPLGIQSATYSRDANGTLVDVTARALSSPGQGAAKLSAGGPNVIPVLMQGPTALGDWYAQGVPFPADQPPGQITVTNSGDAPPTSVTSAVADVVTVKSAVFDSAGTLTVVATSSDKGAGTFLPPALSLSAFPLAVGTATGGTADPAEVTFTTSITPIAPNTKPIAPTAVRVASAAGGQGLADVLIGNQQPYPAGVPFVIADNAAAIQGGPAIFIDVLGNDLTDPSAPFNLPSLTVLAPNANLGTAVPTALGCPAPSTTCIRYTPPLTTGVATFRYTVANSAGISNVGTVTVTVDPSPNPAPIAVADGPFSVQVNTVTAFALTANDNANGGTLDQNSIQVTQPAAGTGTVVVGPTPGSVTYTAPATATSFSFTYTVANTNGSRSAPATVSGTVVPAADNINVAAARFRIGIRRWDVSGTASVSTGNTVTIKLVRGPAGPNETVVGTIATNVPVVGGAWTFSQTGSNVIAQTNDRVRVTSTAGGSATLVVQIRQ